MPTAPSANRLCPNCRTPVPPGKTQCPACGMDKEKMAAFAAAQKAAQARGIKSAKIERSSAPAASSQSAAPKFWISPKIIAAIVIIAAAAGGIYWFTRPPPPPWLKFPTSREDAVKQFVNDIADDSDAAEHHAYSLISLEVRDPNDSEESGEYRQIIHNVHQYLTDDVSDNWPANTQITADPKDPDLFIVKADIETLHIRVSQQTPADQLAKAPAAQSPDEKARTGPHFGIVGIDEFDIHNAAAMQQTAAIFGVVKGYAGQAAVDNIQTIIGAAGGHARETPMQTKIRLLPILRNPREISRQAVIKSWPVRADPVIRRRLTDITTDARFDPLIQKSADDVLKDNVSLEERVAVGVD